MKKGIILIIFTIISASLIHAQDIDKEKEIIKTVIQDAYVDGLLNKGEVSDIEKGFHPGFNLLGLNQNSLTKYPIYSWLESFERRKKKNPEPVTVEEKFTCDYLLIDITENAAMAKIQLKRNNEIAYTDYLQLYKFEEGWKIVSKIYYSH